MKRRKEIIREKGREGKGGGGKDAGEMGERERKGGGITTRAVK